MRRKSDRKELQRLTSTIDALEKRMSVLENEKQSVAKDVNRNTLSPMGILMLIVTKPFMMMIKTFGAALALEMMNHVVSMVSTPYQSQPPVQSCLLHSKGLSICHPPPMHSAHTMHEFKM
jgi:hypothetical protein